MLEQKHKLSQTEFLFEDFLRMKFLVRILLRVVKRSLKRYNFKSNFFNGINLKMVG